MGCFVNMSDGSYYWIDESKDQVMKKFKTEGPFVDLRAMTGATVTVNTNQVTHVQEDE